MRPTQKATRLPSPLGGPHVLFDGSFILEFLEPSPELARDAPPLHIHFTQVESFIIEAGAIGTTTTYDVIDTIHTITASHQQSAPRAGLSPPVPMRNDDDGVIPIPPWTPHNFWPVVPTHPFWSTAEGPRSWSGGILTTDFPPDMDAAFFLAILSLVDAISAKRISMSPSLVATLLSMQTESDSAKIMAPTACWLGPLRWWVPWKAQVAVESVRKLLGGRSAVKVVEDIIETEVVKRQ
ncbi:uncharacterized protein BJX67DRAFT_371079 [Aspergillus lucknowensis]|uniref:Uncharacterized protein n=1 Tax=Aspergillus lucknowensis TaxID=176173 RepID=A0ABR4M0I0_9EURO